MLRNDLQYVAMINELVAELHAGVTALDITGTQRRELQGLIDSYLASFEALVAIDAQITEGETLFREDIHLLEPVLDQVISESGMRAVSARGVIVTKSRIVFLIVIGGIVLATLMGLMLSWRITRSLTRPVAALVTAAEKISDGDLTQRVSVMTNDEIATFAILFNEMVANLQTAMARQIATQEYIEAIVSKYSDFVQRVTEGDLVIRLQLEDAATVQYENDDLEQLGGNLNVMVESLNNMVQQTRQAATNVTTATTEILAATQQQSVSAIEQDATITQTMTTVEELVATVKQAAERAQLVEEDSRQSVVVSGTGQEAVSETVQGMQYISEQVDNIATTILTLSEHTQQISGIIETITDIADQSKLLALNASIEAARAGEEGRGFNIVAQEVRQLAEQSRTATVQVSNILNEIQRLTNTAVMVTEEGNKGAGSGMLLVEKAGTAIHDLTEVIEVAAQSVSQIAVGTHQQRNGMEQLTAAMQSIKQASTQSAASTRQTEQSVQLLNEAAHRMEQTIAHYRL